jgi:hypothetical protein
MMEWMYRSTFSYLDTSWRWVVSFKPLPLYPQGKSPRTHWIGGWVDREPVWKMWRRENSWPYRDSKSDPSVVQRVASRYIDWAIPAPQWLFNPFEIQSKSGNVLIYSIRTFINQSCSVFLFFSYLKETTIIQMNWLRRICYIARWGALL